MQNIIEINKLIKDRYSTVNFSDRMIPSGDIDKILEAARWSASAFNEQPWRFIIGTKDKPDQYKKVLECLAEANQVWSKNAPMLILTLAAKNFVYNDSKNRHALHDVGLATANMFIQALDLGIYSHPMSGFNTGKASETFNIPKDFEPVAAIAFGYMGNKDSLPGDLLKRENGQRKRKPLNEIVFKGNFTA